MLRLDRQVHGRGFAQLTLPPKPLEKVETEVTAQRLLDYLTVPLAGSRGTNLDGA